MAISDNLNLPASRSQHPFFNTQRPWPEFFSNPSSYSLPCSLGEFTSRVQLNLNYFLINYVDIVFLMVYVWVFVNLWHPSSSIYTIGILWVAWRCLYLRRNNDQVVVVNRSVENKLALVPLGIGTAVVLALSGLWLPTLLGLGIVVLHTAFRISDDLFLDEEEAAAEGGLLSAVDSK